MISERSQRLKYVLADFASANVAWFAYNCCRFLLGGVRGFSTLGDFLSSHTIIYGQIALPLLMMGVHYLSGYYNEVFRKSRLSELATTIKTAALNTLLAFFIALINDMMTDNRGFNYEIVLVLFGLLFFFTYLLRVCITSRTSSNIKHRRWRFNTLVVGAGASAYAFVEKLNRMRQSTGYHVVGYVDVPGENRVKDITLPVYRFDEIAEVCKTDDVKELIVVHTNQDNKAVLSTINRLYAFDLPIKVTPERFNMLSRSRLSDFSGDPLVDVSVSQMDASTRNLKRVLDVVCSLTALVLLMPVYAVVAVLIKCDSKGPVFFFQERLGLHNKPFRIVKFRTMVDGAEQAGQPQLSSDSDPRITKLGRTMRKYRIDELPQFWNVLKGDMSMVGPRPEREYYARQILEREPAYSLIHKVRPGITSLGQVKFGYAKNVDEMVERLRYDLLYLDNVSLINDFKIIAYTIKIVFKGRGL
ncbi:MAG: sugar transferase [Bacteroidales bacterium]|nr:sugar transferase [Bacteroidales bacterium]